MYRWKSADRLQFGRQLRIEDYRFQGESGGAKLNGQIPMTAMAIAKNLMVAKQFFQGADVVLFASGAVNCSIAGGAAAGGSFHAQGTHAGHKFGAGKANSARARVDARYKKRQNQIRELGRMLLHQVI